MKPSQTLAELIEEFVADRFTEMDDTVLETLYADLPDTTYLKGVVKGLRRNLMRQIPPVNVEEAYPQTTTVAETSFAQLASEIIQEDNPAMPVDEVAQMAAEIVAASAEEPDDDDVDNSEALRFRHTSVPSLSELTQGTDKGWPTEFTKEEIQQMTVSKNDLRQLTVTKEDLRQMVVTKEDLERVGMVSAAPRFMSRAERFGTTDVELAQLLSQAKPGSVFSQDTIKAEKDKSLVLVKSPETRHFEPRRLLEQSDPQYYQYMWQYLFEAIDTLLNDDTLPVNRIRRLDDETILTRLGDVSAAAVQTITVIGNKHLLIKENVNYFMQQCNERELDVKLFMGDKVYKQSAWLECWKHAVLQTSKGKFNFGDVEVDVVWQAK